MNQINWLKISTKTSDKNIPNIYQNLYIYQIKNVYTKLFENIPNFSNWLYIYIYIYQLATLVSSITEHIQTHIAYSFYNSLWHHHPDCYASCRLIFLPYVCFASIHASTAAKSYILNYMWTAANFIIEGRMRPYGRRLCTVAVAEWAKLEITGVVELAVKWCSAFPLIL